MTTSIPAPLFADPAPAPRLERAAAALTAHGFTVEILADAAAARTRVKDLIPEGASAFTGASETLRRSGIEDHCLPLENDRTPAAAPSCCSARPSDSKTPLRRRPRGWPGPVSSRLG